MFLQSRLPPIRFWRYGRPLRALRRVPSCFCPSARTPAGLIWAICRPWPKSRPRGRLLRIMSGTFSPPAPPLAHRPRRRPCLTRHTTTTSLAMRLGPAPRMSPRQYRQQKPGTRRQRIAGSCWNAQRMLTRRISARFSPCCPAKPARHCQTPWPSCERPSISCDITQRATQTPKRRARSLPFRPGTFPWRFSQVKLLLDWLREMPFWQNPPNRRP